MHIKDHFLIFQAFGRVAAVGVAPHVSGQGGRSSLPVNPNIQPSFSEFVFRTGMATAAPWMASALPVMAAVGSSDTSRMSNGQGLAGSSDGQSLTLILGNLDSLFRSSSPRVNCYSLISFSFKFSVHNNSAADPQESWYPVHRCY